jgi:hypothetical protein
VVGRRTCSRRGNPYRVAPHSVKPLNYNTIASVCARNLSSYAILYTEKMMDSLSRSSVFGQHCQRLCIQKGKHNVIELSIDSHICMIMQYWHWSVYAVERNEHFILGRLCQMGSDMSCSFVHGSTDVIF